MSRVDELVDILKRLNEGDNPDEVRQEAKELLKSVDASDLSAAEQKLIEEGLAVEDLRGLCSIHMEVLGDQLEDLRSKLEPGHVVHTLVEEHEMILDFLSKLDKTNKSIQQMDEYDPEREEFEMLHHVAEHLVEAEPHHEREEEVLFPELVEKGVSGPPEIMRLEHVALRAQKKRLLELAENAGDMDFDEFKREVNETTNALVPSLTDHIWKENNILYPTAIELIKEETVWEELKLACDQIGYCCFTPEA